MSVSGSSLGRQTIVYAVGVVIGKLASFIMLPVYTRYLTPADYGVLELLTMTIEVIAMIAGIGLLSGTFKFYSEADTAREKDLMLSTAGIGTIGLAVVTTALGLLAAPLLTRVVFGEDTSPLYMQAFFLLYLLGNFEHVPMARIRVQQRATLYVAIGVAKLIAMLSLNVLFVVHYRMGIWGVMLSNAIVTGLLAAGLTAYLFRDIGFGFSTATFRRMVAFGSPMILWSLGAFVLVFSDRYFLNHYAGTTEVGVYSLAYKFAFVLSALAHHPFHMMWDPQRFEVAKRPDAHLIYPRVFLYLNVVLGLGAAGISLFIKDLLSVMSDPAFLPAYRVVPIILVSQIVYLWVDFYNLGLYLKNRTPVLGTIAVVMVPLTLLLNMALIPRFGMFGAAWATLGAYSVRSLCVYYFAQRSYPIQLGWSRIVRLYASLAVVVGLGFAVEPAALAGSVAWNTVLMLIATGIVYRYILDAAARDRIQEMLQRLNRFPSLHASRA